jgi:hypothetical protein
MVRLVIRMVNHRNIAVFIFLAALFCHLAYWQGQINSGTLSQHPGEFMNYGRILAFSVVLITIGTSLAAQAPKSSLVAEITGADLGGDFLGVSPEGFDISPNGSQIAVVFETAQTEGEVKAAGIWVATWDLSTRKLLNKVEIEGPLTAEQLAIAGMDPDLRYTPGGNTLVVQSGLRIVVVRAADLAKVQSINPKSLPTTSRNGTFIWGFDVSGDGRWLAVLTGTGLDSRPIAGIQLIDLSASKLNRAFTGRIQNPAKRAGRSWGKARRCAVS